jgi:hypothetical protein
MRGRVFCQGGEPFARPGVSFGALPEFYVPRGT